MNKAFEKIIRGIESLKSNKGFGGTIQTMYADGMLDKAKKIVQEVAEEYNNGWIPCSDRLPEDDSICIVTVEYPNNETVVDYGWFDIKRVCWFVGMQEFRTSNILAWQPLPEPFKGRD